MSFGNFGLPATEKLWPEAQNYACDVLNRTATASNPGYKSPYEMWYGKPPPPTLLEWLQPCFYPIKRSSKTDAQAKPACFLGPAKNHPHDCVRVYSKETRQVLITRNVTWQYVPPAIPSPALQKTLHEAPMPVGGEDPVEEGMESTSRPGGGGLNASEDDDEDDPEMTWIENSLKTAGGDVDAVAGAKPTAVGLHEGPPGAGEGMINDPSSHNSSDAGASSSADSGGSGSAEIDGGDSSAGGGSNSSVAGKSDSDNRSNSGNTNGSESGSGSGGACQLPRLEANRLKWTISPPNLSLSRTRGETRRFTGLTLSP